MTVRSRTAAFHLSSAWLNLRVSSARSNASGPLKRKRPRHPFAPTVPIRASSTLSTPPYQPPAAGLIMEDAEVPVASDWEAYDPAKAVVDVDPDAATGSPEDAAHLRSFARVGGAPKAATYFSADRRVRVQILSDSLVRIEYAHDENLFEDRPTFCFVQRGLARGAADAKVTQLGDRGLVVRTAKIAVVIDPPEGGVGVRGNGAIVANLVDPTGLEDDLGVDPEGSPEDSRISNSKAFVGLPGADDGDLLGTCRTLDETDGYARRDGKTHLQRRVVQLGYGLLSRQGGITFIEDTLRPVFTDDGWFDERPTSEEYVDTYALACDTDYRGALQEFTSVAGRIPMIPRRYLGNWWSRYHAYTQNELGDLMVKFEKYRVPLSMCIIDMDWHLVKHEDGVAESSDGWTGLTWNKRLFPDPAGFIQWLHDRDLGTALNLHPAGGVHSHEENYEAFAKFIGAKALATRGPIPFDITDLMSCCAYFKTLIHPLEEGGGELGKWSWWCDWQQGAESRMRGVDPLFLLNHLHYRDMERLVEDRVVRRPVVFSRFAGLGSHRTPIGFSGDTHSSWASLAFQTFMTPTASNSAFTYWSHDIGGHTSGAHDGTLYVRWVQFACFSPILRLHSSNNPYSLRMPWSFGRDACDAASEAMRLRHRLVPYIYSVCRKTYTDTEPLVMPMYYNNPVVSDAFAAPGQYWFGDQLVVAPVSSAPDSETGLSRQAIWLPPLRSESEGTQWRDIFSGEARDPGWSTVYCGLDRVPVFAAPGGIVPMAAAPDACATGAALNSIGNPPSLELRIVAGGDGSFDLYEDEECGDLRAFSTNIQVKHSADCLRVVISPPQRVKELPGGRNGEFCTGPASVDDVTGVIPLERSWRVVVVGISDEVEATCCLSESGGERSCGLSHYDSATEIGSFEISGASWKDTITMELRSAALLAARNRSEEKAKDIISALNVGVARKWDLGNLLPRLLEDPGLLREGVEKPEQVPDPTGSLFTVTAAMKLALLETIGGCGYTRPYLTRPGAPAVVWAGRRDDVEVSLDDGRNLITLNPGSAVIVYPTGTREAELRPPHVSLKGSAIHEAVSVVVNFGGVARATIPMRDPDDFEGEPKIVLRSGPAVV